MEEKIIYFFEQFWTFVSVSVGIAIGGVAAKRIVALLVPVERKIQAAEEGGPYRTKGRLSVADLATDSALPIWYRAWRATISAHPLIIGALIGLAPIPAAVWVPPAVASRMLWFGLAGALSGQVFEVLNRLKEVVIAVVRQKLGGPPEPPDDETSDGPHEDRVD
jgi:hypothetical protein